MTTNISLRHESVFLSYETMYNDNKHFYYTRECIITNLFIIHESVYHGIQDDVFLLYETMYNDNKYFYYT